MSIISLLIAMARPSSGQEALDPSRLNSSPASSEDLEFFESSVRPLLIQRCLDCHSREAETNGGLSLDSKEDWLQGGDSGPAIQPQNWRNSLVWKAVGYREPHLQMPPDGKLNEQELGILERWLSQGAFDPRKPMENGRKKQTGLALDQAQTHWAYRPPQTSIDVPITNERGNGKSIDAFLRQRWEMEKQNISFEEIASPEVARSVWIQRLCVDLTGMRPTFEEWSHWRAIESTDEIVDQLLASPRFGEHLARQWMDQVRFAESLTLRGFVLPDAWRYRNYLIESFNQDKPFNQFVIEQIAGDLLDSPDLHVRQQQCIATTMLALGDTNLEEQDKKQLEMDYIDEQLDVIGKVFLGQTLGCARCHDHKFDPIPTQDYYALAGILKSSTSMLHDNVSNWVRLPLPVDLESQRGYQQAEKDVVVNKRELDAWKQRLSGKSSKARIWSINQLAGIVVDDSVASKTGLWTSSTHQKAYVGEGYLHDANDRSEVKSIVFSPSDLPPGRYRLRIAYSHGSNRASNALVRVWSADGEDTIRLDQRQEPQEEGLWKTLGEYSFEQGGKHTVALSNEGADGHVIADAIQFLRIDAGGNDAKDMTSTTIAEYSEDQIKEKILAFERSLNEANHRLSNRPMFMSLKVDRPVDLPIHVRGSVHQLGEVVPRGFLRCISVEGSPRVSPTSDGRLELAQWLASPKNPLTARVYVNRVWDQLMGMGLVRTPDNFGTTGDQPTHPELLDWLTNRFIEHGWSTKWLVREIVHSKAYRRGSEGSESARSLDPENRFWTRGVLRRLPSEAMRDGLLSASGEIDFAVQLEGLFPKTLKEDYRFSTPPRFRSVQGPWFRNSPMEMYGEFDGANLSFSIGKRSRSTVVQQALLLLNSPWITDRAHRLATRVFAEDSPAKNRIDRIQLLFVSLVGREPTPQEVAWANETLADESTASYQLLVKQLVRSIDFRFVE